MPTLNRLTRKDGIRATSRVAFRLLQEVADYSSCDGNMLIQGDNLDALKALLPFYGDQRPDGLGRHLVDVPAPSI